MAADQTKPADAADDGTSEDETKATAKPDAADAPELDDVKRKFREALDRKRGTHASANAEGVQETGKVQGSHGPASSRRSFRRKSGS
jgi:hypothetical protein